APGFPRGGDRRPLAGEGRASEARARRAATAGIPRPVRILLARPRGLASPSRLAAGEFPPPVPAAALRRPPAPWPGAPTRIRRVGEGTRRAGPADGRRRAHRRGGHPEEDGAGRGGRGATGLFRVAGQRPCRGPEAVDGLSTSALRRPCRAAALRRPTGPVLAAPIRPPRISFPGGGELRAHSACPRLQSGLIQPSIPRQTGSRSGGAPGRRLAAGGSHHACPRISGFYSAS